MLLTKRARGSASRYRRTSSGLRRLVPLLRGCPRTTAPRSAFDIIADSRCGDSWCPRRWRTRASPDCRHRPVCTRSSRRCSSTRFRDLAAPVDRRDLGRRGASRLLVAAAVRGLGGGRRIGSGDVPGLRRRVRAGRGSRLPRCRDGADRLHHPVPLQAGDGGLRRRPGDLRRGRATLQALRRAQARGATRSRSSFRPSARCPRPTGPPSRSGAVSLALLFLLPLLSKKIPAGLVVLFGAIGVSSALDLAGKYGVEVVGTLPGGLPSVSLPRCRSSTSSAWCCRRSASCSWCSANRSGPRTSSRTKHGYEVDADQELNAHAFANMGSALFGGMLVGGSMSASAVKEAPARARRSATW